MDLQEIRKAERESHEEIYGEKELFAPGSWLARPVKTVLELLPLFAGYRQFRALDLGCGVGRNSIPVAQAFPEIPCRVDCVDILEVAIQKLAENAASHGVADSIRGILSAIDDFEIEPEGYDLILTVSALEHVDSPETFAAKLRQIRTGVRENGVVCMIINSNVRERDKAAGLELEPQFEVNLSTEDLSELLAETFGDWEMIKTGVNHQHYDIPRPAGLAELETDVVTWVCRKRKC